MTDAEIIFETAGAVGRVTLNRPKALNALTAGMCEALFAQLQAWRDDAHVKAVIVKGAGGKAFCAGGDVIRLYEDGKAGGPYPHQFYWAEYRCDALIKHYPKPYVALLDGVVMGGGVGVSIHGSHRIATDKTLFAMPETGIGLFPDVGGTFFLPRLPGCLGMYLGLTGRRLKGADCAAIGLAEAYIQSEKLADFEAAIAASGDVNAAIASFAQPLPEAPILAERTEIDRHFGHGGIDKIINSLANDPGEWAKSALATLKQKSPLSLVVTFRQLSEGKALSFDAAMRLEWRLASRFAKDADFYEGVRALLVDKDMKPQWNPARLEDVTADKVAAYFAPLPKGELDLSGIAEGG